MAEHVHRCAEGLDDFGEVAGHVGIGLALGPEAGAVVAHVHADDAAVVRKAFGDGPPVPGGPEEAVDYEKGRQAAGRADVCMAEHAPV